MANDEWQTPPDLFAQLDAEFGFDLDAAVRKSNALCGNFLSSEQDGLEVPWHEVASVVWLNPPYSRGSLDKWLRKSYEEALLGCTVVCLIPVDTSTSWWKNWAVKAAERRELTKRVRHWLNGAPVKGSPTFSSVVLVFDENRRLPRVIPMEVP